jgi:hypothetical protein
MKFRLSEEDAQRLGCPRDVEFREDRIMGREAIALSKIGWPLERISLHVGGRPVVDDDGKAMHDLDEHGEVRRDPAGNPVVLLTIDPEAMLAMLWVAVRRTGVEVAWRDFDLNLMAVEWVEEDEPGKAKPTRSRTGTKATRRR